MHHQIEAVLITPLKAEMELYSSSLVRIRVRFHDRQQESDQVMVGNGLAMGFRPVVTAICRIEEFHEAKPGAESKSWLGARLVPST